jgi:hypothetical protein
VSFTDDVNGYRLGRVSNDKPLMFRLISAAMNQVFAKKMFPGVVHCLQLFRPKALVD